MRNYRDQIEKAAKGLQNFQLNSDLFRNKSSKDLEDSLSKMIAWYEFLDQKKDIIAKYILIKEQ